jgi:hypothetical protein
MAPLFKNSRRLNDAIMPPFCEMLQELGINGNYGCILQKLDFSLIHNELDCESDNIKLGLMVMEIVCFLTNG